VLFFNLFFLHTIRSTPLKIVLQVLLRIVLICIYVKSIYDFCTSRARRTFSFHTSTITRRTTANHSHIIIKVAILPDVSTRDINRPLSIPRRSRSFLHRKCIYQETTSLVIFIVILTLWFFNFLQAVHHPNVACPSIYFRDTTAPMSIQASPEPKKQRLFIFTFFLPF